MSNLFVTCSLVCALVFHVVQARHVIEHHHENPTVLTTTDSLYQLWKVDSTIHINSTKENFKHCMIHMDKVKNFTGLKVQAEPLFDHKFILWGFNTHEDDYFVAQLYSCGSLTVYNYTALLIDPLSCSYKILPIPEEKKPRGDHPLSSTHVEASQTGFDLFYPNHGKCSPCRFSPEGDLIPLDYQLEFEEDMCTPNSFFIQTVEEFGASKHSIYYVYTQNFDNSTAVIRYLDSEFKVVKQKYLQHPIHSFSMHDKNPYVFSICYTSHRMADSIGKGTFKVHCEQLDSDFKSKFVVQLPVPDTHFVYGLAGITHQVDSMGNMFIELEQLRIPKNSKERDIQMTNQRRFFVINKTGKLIETRDYEKENPQIFELHSHLSDDKKFCVTAESFLEAPANTQIHCYDVTKYQS